MSNGEVSLSVRSKTQFPHFIHQQFELNIVPSNDHETIADSLVNFLVVRITNASGTTLENSNFGYGLSEKITSEFKGKFITIPTWQITSDRRMINLSIWFSQISNNTILEFYQINASSKSNLQQKMANLKSEKMIYKSKISLLVPIKLKISVNGTDDSRNEFTSGEVVIVTCRVTETIPKQTPIFTNLEIFTVKAHSFNVERNEREVTILVSISDHTKSLICTDGFAKVSMDFHIFHPPTVVTVNPDVQDEVGNDSIITCKYKDGYPTPTVQWRFIDGPSDAKQWYKISKSGKHFHIQTDNITNIRWSFNCSAHYSFLNAIRIIHKTISFVVKKEIKDKKTYQNDQSIVEYKLEQLTGKSDNLSKQIRAIKQINEKVDKRVLDLENYHVNQTKKNKEMQNTDKKIQEQLNLLKSENEKLFEKSDQNYVNLFNRFSDLLKQLNMTRPSKENQGSLINDKTKNQFQSDGNLAPFVWAIKNFEEALKSAKSAKILDVFSRPFYSHKNGYKMILRAFPAGIFGKDSYFHLYFHILKGEFDHLLPWPMKYEIIVELINQNTGHAYFIKNYKYNPITDKGSAGFGRPTSYMNPGLGWDKFLNTDDVMDNPAVYKNKEIQIKCTMIP